MIKTIALETNRNKYICVKLMHLPAREYMKAAFVRCYIPMFIQFIPAVTLFSMILGASAWWGLIFAFIITTSRVFWEAVHLFIHKKTGVIIAKNQIIIWVSIFLGLMSAVLVTVFKLRIFTSSFIVSIPTIVLVLATFIGGVLYLIKFNGYQDAVDAVTKQDDPLLNVMNNFNATKFDDVKIKDKEFYATKDLGEKYKNKEGYDFFNAIFFERYRRLFEKPIINRLIIIFALFAGLVVASFMFPQVENGINKLKVNSLLPVLVFVMYFVAIGSKACKAMFYNCDISLLKYGYYRQKSVLLKNFQIRLNKISFLNLIPALAICIVVFLSNFLFNMSWSISDFIVFIVSILFLAIFFSVHHLFMYYIFQPYTTDAGVRNPFFAIVNFIVYLLALVSNNIRNAPAYFAALVISVTFVYIVIALILVYRIAPKTFTVK